MKLHLDKKLFTDSIRVASQHLHINPVYIEKDYWITQVLFELANSKYAENIVFKGGTSLSKGYGLINRFSEDVDIAIINEVQKSGNEIKTLIRAVEKIMTKELTEMQVEGVSSKGSRFRKSVFEYVSIDARNHSNKLIVEVNSFANPHPFQRLKMESFITSFLHQTNNTEYIEKYNLQHFEINVLDKRQTMIEKLVSLIRCSFDENAISSIASKIRHFYDLYFLMNDAECAAFITSKTFLKQFNETLAQDRITFDIPKDWNKKSIAESPLVADFDTIWNQIKTIYTKELSALAFTEIPTEMEVATNFRKLIKLVDG